MRVTKEIRQAGEMLLYLPALVQGVNAVALFGDRQNLRTSSAWIVSQGLSIEIICAAMLICAFALAVYNRFARSHRTRDVYVWFILTAPEFIYSALVVWYGLFIAPGAIPAITMMRYIELWALLFAIYYVATLLDIGSGHGEGEVRRDA